MIDTKDLEFLKMAIENSKKSSKESRFPAGAVVVKDNKIITSEVSVPYPGLFHADSKAIVNAFNKIGPLKDATLYIGLESCLMCTGIAYWSGLRRMVYAVPKSKVSGDYYETYKDTTSLIDSFNDRIEKIQVTELEKEAIVVIREWEKKYLIK